MILSRMRDVVDCELCKEQADFRPKRSCTKQRERERERGGEEEGASECMNEIKRMDGGRKGFMGRE